MDGANIENAFFLSQVLSRKVFCRGKRIGKLQDLVVRETGVVPQVTDLVVGRSFGYKSLVIPYERVSAFDGRNFTVDVDEPEAFERDHFESLHLLNDHIMDKKIVDMEDHEVEMVYDIKLAHSQKGLFVTDVDCSRYSFLRRLGLGAVARLIHSLAESIRDETISWKFVQPLSQELGSFTGRVKLNVLKEKIHEIHPTDLADILEELNPEERLDLFNSLDDEKASDTLEEIEPRVQREIITSIGDEKAADLIEDMTPAQAADVLSALPAADADDILALIEEKDHARKIESLMEDYEKSLLDFATAEFIKFAPETTVAEVFVRYKDVAKDAEVIWYIYVVDADDKLVGVVNFHSILRSEPSMRLEEIMVHGVKALHQDDTLAEAARKFDQYMFRAIPVVNDDEVVLGVVLYKDVMRLAHPLV